jgi:A/G-specific adenine glycosylase
MSSRSFSSRLLDWYARNKRDLPWRHTHDPYRIWVSETLLQQTQVATVIPYYERFVARFPDIRALAAAPLDEVLKAWEGAGYYARARNLHRAAQQVVEQHRGRVPQRVDELLKLPGVGRYIAGAVASIAFNQDAPILDGNVTRVLCRYFNIRGDPDKGMGRAERERLWKLAEELIPHGRARDFNQALMDHGATVCLPRGPRCEICPVRRGCKARRLGVQEELPTKRAKPKRPHYEIGAGIIWKRGRILIQRRPPQGLLGGLWEFPGGKRERGETFQECVRREVHEELGIEVKVGEELAVVEHGYSHFTITLHAFTCEHVRGRVRLLHATAFKWVRPDELKEYAFPAANRKIIEAVTSAARSPNPSYCKIRAHSVYSP